MTLTPKDLRVIVQPLAASAQSQIPRDCAFYRVEPMASEGFEGMRPDFSYLRANSWPQWLRGGREILAGFVCYCKTQVVLIRGRILPSSWRIADLRAPGAVRNRRSWPAANAD